MRPLRSLTHKSAHGHTWGLLPACSPKGEEHIRKLLCRNRLRGLSWKGTSQSRLFATASKQPACPQSGHEPICCFGPMLISNGVVNRKPSYFLDSCHQLWL